MKIKIGVAILLLLSSLLNIQQASAVDSETLKDLLGGSNKSMYMDITKKQ